MTLQPGDKVIVLHPGGQISYWQQDTPDILEYLEQVQALSTCDCNEDICPAHEMDSWRLQLYEGIITVEGPEQLTLRLHS
jgi:hypothetical protein